MKSKTIKFFTLMMLVSFNFLLFNSVVAASIDNEKPSIFNISSKLFIDGKLISSPRIISKENQPASIFITNKDHSNSLKIGVVAKDIKGLSNLKDIKLDFDIQYKNGQEQFFSKPQFVLMSNQQGSVKIYSVSGHSYELQVLVTRT